MRLRFILLFFLLLKLNVNAQFINIDSCLKILPTLKEDTNKVILLNRIAWDISYKNLQAGLDYANKSMALAKQLNCEELYPKIYNTLGAIYDDKAERAKALDMYLLGLQYTKKLNQTKSYGFLYNSLGNLYSKQNESQKAKMYYLLCLKYSKITNSINASNVAASNLASIYSALKQPDSAIFYMNPCLSYNLKHNVKDKLVYNYLMLSDIYYENNEADKSLNAALQGASLAKEIGDTYTLAHAYLQISSSYYLKKDLPGAINALHDAIKTAKVTGDIPALENSNLYLSQYLEEINDFKGSLKYYKDYNMYKDSSLNNESVSQMRNAEAKYENEKKQTEIELLSEKQKHNDAENQKKKVYLYAALIGIIGLGFMLLILYRNNKIKHKANKNLEAYNLEINKQKELVELKNKEITDSINYAQRIQQNILTSENYFKKYTSDYFILFKPKDIVSGDFYWAYDNREEFVVVTADCTGHGVPGAMMSMLGINLLNEIVVERKVAQPAVILNQLRKDIVKILNPEESTIESKDGMDCTLLSINNKTLELTYCNANNSFYIIRDGKLITSTTNKMPVGAGHYVNEPFVQQQIKLQKKDIIITLTDGYADQFGGAQGKKIKYRALEKTILENCNLPLELIKQRLNKEIEIWKGNLEQVDDICIVGIKI